MPATDQIKGLFPDGKAHVFDGKEFVLLPHTETEVFLLRKLGYDAASPVITQYSWPAPAHKPAFDVQKKTTALLTMNERAYVLNGMGTGKTKCPLWAWDYLRSQKRIGKMIVFAPLSTLKFTWEREAFETLPGVKVGILHGSKAQRLKVLADPDVEIFVINHDGHKVILDELLKRSDINCLVIDELAVYRNKSERTKAMITYAGKMKWVWGMSGSPMPHSPTDVFHQAKIVTPHSVPKYFKQFRDDLLYKIDNFKYLPRPDAVDKAFDVMQPAVRFTIDEVQELPECIERTIDCPMGPKQAKVYKEIVNHCQSAIAGGTVTAANAGAAMNKLLQISSGWVYDKDGKTHALDNDSRVQALMDGIASTNRKVLVFAPFKHALAGISAALTANGHEHATVSGDTPMKERNTIFNLFQNSSKYQVLNAHPQCLAHGITLTAADVIIWFGPTLSLEIFDQANHRIKRVGQKHKQQILCLQGSPVEKKIYRLLRNAQDVQTSFLTMFEGTNEDW